MRTYHSGDTIRIEFTFYNNQNLPAQTDAGVLLTIGEPWITAMPVVDAPMNFDSERTCYTFDWLVPANMVDGLYHASGKGLVATKPQEQSEDISLWSSYVTADEIRLAKVWFDFSKYSDAELNYAASLARELLDSYLDTAFWHFYAVQKWQTTVDKQWRIFMRFRYRPIKKVTYMKVRVPWSTEVVCFPTYMDLFEREGYGYYPISTAYWASAVGTYPLIVLGHTDKLHYTVKYEVDSDVPMVVKQAIALICMNILKSDFYLGQTGIVGVVWNVNSFTSGEYSVNFWNNNATYNWKGYAGGIYLTPAVQELLDRLKVMKTNLF